MASDTSKPVEYEGEIVSADHVERLRRVTNSQSKMWFPPTYPTIYRMGEFEWLKRLDVNLRQLLHTEQEYEYLKPLEVGKTPLIRTYLKSEKKRRGLLFLLFESLISMDGVDRMVARTQFVIREGEESAK